MRRISGWKSIIVFIVLWASVVFYIFPIYTAKLNHAAGIDVQLLDARFSYTKQEVSHLFNTIGYKGQQIYLSISGGIDMIYPLIYGFLLYLFLLKFSKHTINNKLRIIYIAPWIGVLFDYIENFCIINMLQNPYKISKQQVVISSYATTLKWVFLGLTVLLIVILGIKKHLATSKK